MFAGLRDIGWAHFTNHQAEGIRRDAGRMRGDVRVRASKVS